MFLTYKIHGGDIHCIAVRNNKVLIVCIYIRTLLTVSSLSQFESWVVYLEAIPTMVHGP